MTSSDVLINYTHYGSIHFLVHGIFCKLLKTCAKYLQKFWNKRISQNTVMSVTINNGIIGNANGIKMIAAGQVDTTLNVVSAKYQVHMKYFIRLTSLQ